jgi:hypothetical protein
MLTHANVGCLKVEETKQPNIIKHNASDTKLKRPTRAVFNMMIIDHILFTVLFLIPLYVNGERK